LFCGRLSQTNQAKQKKRKKGKKKKRKRRNEEKKKKKRKKENEEKEKEEKERKRSDGKKRRAKKNDLGRGARVYRARVAHARVHAQTGKSAFFGTRERGQNDAAVRDEARGAGRIRYRARPDVRTQYAPTLLFFFLFARSEKRKK
jgi:outer membrane biosynthesis protein TonB